MTTDSSYAYPPEVFEALRPVFESDDPADVVAAFVAIQTTPPPAPLDRVEALAIREIESPLRLAKNAEYLSSLRDRATALRKKKTPRFAGALIDIALVIRARWSEQKITQIGLYGQPEWVRIAAVRRLVRRWFTRWQVFHPNRWEFLAEAFSRRVLEHDENPQRVWEDLAIPPVLNAIQGLPGNQTVKSLFQIVRAHVRSAVERELFGHTLDETMREIPTDPDLSEPPLPEDILALADERLDLWEALGRLTPREREILWRTAVYDEDGGSLGRHLGMSPAAVWKALSRARFRLRKKLSG